MDFFTKYCRDPTWVVIIGKSCTKNGKNNLLGSVKYIKNKRTRIYSIFRTGLKWIKRCMKHANQIFFQ